MSSDKNPAPKLGAGNLQAMGRLGLAELRAAAYSDSPIAQTDPGLYGNALPSEVVGQRQAETQAPSPGTHATLGDRVAAAERQVSAQRQADLQHQAPAHEAPAHERE